MKLIVGEQPDSAPAPRKSVAGISDRASTEAAARTVGLPRDATEAATTDLCLNRAAA